MISLFKKIGVIFVMLFLISGCSKPGVESERMVFGMKTNTICYNDTKYFFTGLDRRSLLSPIFSSDGTPEVCNMDEYPELVDFDLECVDSSTYIVVHFVRNFAIAPVYENGVVKKCN